MRKFIAAGILAALSIIVLAIPASASFDRHFTVLSKSISNHRTSDGFRFRDKLVEPGDRDNGVGRDHGECKVKAHNRFKCRGRVHLNGEIGGFGDIGFSGNFSRHDNRINVIGGTHDFNGVAGKILLLERRKLHFDLVR